MYSHTTLGTNDWPRAKPFWDAISEVLELPLMFAHESGAAYGELTGPKIFIEPAFNGEAASTGNGSHIAFLAKDWAMVDGFHVAALENGGSDEGLPGLRPHYHPHYYGAYVRDPDGNKLQAVCHSSKGNIRNETP